MVRKKRDGAFFLTISARCADGSYLSRPDGGEGVVKVMRKLFGLFVAAFLSQSMSVGAEESLVCTAAQQQTALRRALSEFDGNQPSCGALQRILTDKIYEQCSLSSKKVAARYARDLIKQELAAGANLCF